MKLYLDSNENLYNPYKSLSDDFSDRLKEVDFFRYPENSYLELREAYAKYVAVQKENVIAGNGSDEMLNLIISSYIGKNDIMLTFDPDFSMYDYYVSQNEGIIKKYKFDIEKFNERDFIEYAKRINPKIIIFSNPNNPTGIAIESSKVRIILSELKSVKIVVDEAYMEFFGDSVIKFIDEYENLIVTRTLSKAFSLAALRVGFLIANKLEVKKLLALKVPYNVNSISAEIAKIALGNEHLMDITVKKIISNRECIFEFFKMYESRNKNIKFYKSFANYIYATGIGTRKIRGLLEDNNIKIRVFLDDRIRITIGDDNSIKKVMRAIANKEGE